MALKWKSKMFIYSFIFIEKSPNPKNTLRIKGKKRGSLKAGFLHLLGRRRNVWFSSRRRDRSRPGRLRERVGHDWEAEPNCQPDWGRHSIHEAFPGGSDGKETALNAGNLGSIRGLGLAAHSSIFGGFPGGSDSGEGNTHSSILAWTSLWRGEPGGPLSVGSQRQSQLSD